MRRSITTGRVRTWMGDRCRGCRSNWRAGRSLSFMGS
nr:MAG TPA: hypothetical protein [Caudoviricetes sp.]